MLRKAREAARVSLPVGDMRRRRRGLGSSGMRQYRQDAFWCKWGTANPNASRVEKGVCNRSRNASYRRFICAARSDVGLVNQDDFDRLRCVHQLQDWVGRPVDADDADDAVTV